MIDDLGDMRDFKFADVSFVLDMCYLFGSNWFNVGLCWLIQMK